MTKIEYERLCRERQEIISENKARRMRKRPLGTPPEPPLPVPPKPELPLVPVAYRNDGTYEGRLNDADECPPDCVVRWEPVVW